MNLDYLVTFQELVKLGSFSDAAKKLSISQPAVSFQIQKLEHDLGVRLINRGQKSVTVTDAGKRLLKFSRKVTDENGRLLNDLGRLKEEVSGELAVAASTIPGEFLLPSTLSSFMSLHPMVKARVEIHDSLAVIASVQDNSYDIGFCGSTPPQSHGLESFVIAGDEIVPIVYPEHPLAQKKRVSFAELEGEPIILRESTSGTQKSLEALLSAAGINMRQLSPRLVLSNTQAVVSAVEAGAGIAFVSNLAIRKSLELGLVKQLKLDNLELKRSFYCIYHKEKLVSRLLEEFVGFVQMKAPLV